MEIAFVKCSPDHPHSALSMLAHWEGVIEDGALAQSTGVVLIGTAKRVLKACTETWRSIDVTSVDPDACLERYWAVRARTPSAVTARGYRRAMHRVVCGYRDYLAAPERWTARLRRRPGGAPEVGRPGTLAKHKFALRDDATVHVTLPRDATSREIARLCEWLGTLAVDAAPAGRVEAPGA